MQSSIDYETKHENGFLKNRGINHQYQQLVEENIGFQCTSNT